MVSLASPFKGRALIGSILLVAIASGLLIYTQLPYYTATSRGDTYAYGSDYVRHPNLPTIQITSGTDHQKLNHQHLSELHACLAAGRCGKNQDKVVLLAEKYFWEALVRHVAGPLDSL